jgi:hypothetical protein
VCRKGNGVEALAFAGGDYLEPLVPMLPVEPKTATLRVGEEFDGTIITVS